MANILLISQECVDSYGAQFLETRHLFLNYAKEIYLRKLNKHCKTMALRLMSGFQKKHCMMMVPLNAHLNASKPNYLYEHERAVVYINRVW